jgi:hypothetical protein
MMFALDNVTWTIIDCIISTALQFLYLRKESFLLLFSKVYIHTLKHEIDLIQNN